VAAQARRGRPRRRHLARGLRRAGPRPAQPGRGQPGDRPCRRAGDFRRHRRGHARPDADRPRQRGPEAPPPRPDADRRGGVVPAVLGARRGLRPCRHPIARHAAGGRLVAAVGPEGVDHERPVRHLRPAPRADGRRPAQAQGPDHVHRPDGRRGRDDPAAAPDLRRGALQRGVLRRGAPRGGLGGRAGQRRLGRRPDHADVRARGDRARRRGLRLARRSLRRGAAGGPGGRRGQGGPPPLRRDRRGLPRPALHRLPDADHAPARRRARPGGRAGEGHHDQGGDRGRRAAGRRARARRPRRRPLGRARLRPAGPEVRGRDRGDPPQHGRGAGARPAAGAAAGQGDPVLGAARQGTRGDCVNFALTDEQEFLKEAARGALSRFKTVEAAREALDGGELPDLWPTAVEAGWPGLLISEEAGGAGLGVMEGLVVVSGLGRVPAGVPLLGHLPASDLLGRAGHAGEAPAAGDTRAACVPAKPPSDIEAGWTVDARLGSTRGAAPRIADDGTVTGEVPWVPDAPGADVLVVVGANGRAAAVRAEDAEIEAVEAYDRTRSLGHVRFDGSPGTLLEGTDTAAAWYIAQALLAAESLGAVEVALEVSVAYAKERFTFGRAIGSYQAGKHDLVEILRGLENGRSLMYYTGWAGQDKPDEFPLAASAFRLVAGQALDHAARAQISVHGGIGATWEHDAPLYFRRAQLSRRPLAGPPPPPHPGGRGRLA